MFDAFDLKWSMSTSYHSKATRQIGPLWHSWADLSIFVYRVQVFVTTDVFIWFRKIKSVSLELQNVWYYFVVGFVVFNSN